MKTLTNSEILTDAHQNFQSLLFFLVFTTTLAAPQKKWTWIPPVILKSNTVTVTRFIFGLQNNLQNHKRLPEGRNKHLKRVTERIFTTNKRFQFHGSKPTLHLLISPAQIKKVLISILRPQELKLTTICVSKIVEVMTGNPWPDIQVLAGQLVVGGNVLVLSAPNVWQAGQLLLQLLQALLVGGLLLLCV